jgi:nucleolar protein 58
MLAAKSALGLRVDALSTWGVSSEDTSKEPSEEEKSQLGRDARLTIERRLRALEGKPLKSLANANANQTALGGQKKWEVKEARKYNPDADGLTGDEPAADAPKKSKKEVNGTPKGVDKKAAKKAEKEAKKARKAERDAKRDAKAAKKAAKEAKKAVKEVKESSKKRKADDAEEKSDKKKKSKKSKA